MAAKIVKSVARVIEILELFNVEQKPMPAVEIANKLNYPLASTHEILKTLVEYGYFSYGNPKWAFSPSIQFPETVDWVRDAMTDDALLLFMKALNSATRETINLSRRSSSQIKIIKGYECLHEIGVSSKPGTIMAVTESLTGMTSLAHLNSDEVEDHLAKLKQADPQKYSRLDKGLILDVLNEIRECGTATRGDISVEGVGAVCCPVISSKLSDEFVVGIVGPSERIISNADSHRRTLKRIAKQFDIETKYPLKD